MCFSAEASFTVGSVLGVLGLTTLKKVTKWSLKLLALIPLLFAIQQFAEGIVWINTDTEMQRTTCSVVAQTSYLLFAWVIWPVYAPLAFLISEKVPWKQIVCVLCLIIGIYIAYGNLNFLYFNELTAKVVEKNLYYDQTTQYGNFGYAIPVLVPMFISSIKNMWVIGLCLLGGFIVSELMFSSAFTSVWCFFAAVSSIFLLKVLVDAE